MSKSRGRMIGILLAAVAGIAGGAFASYATTHLTAFLFIGIVAAVIVVLIFGATIFTTRRANKPPKSPVD